MDTQFVAGTLKIVARMPVKQEKHQQFIALAAELIEKSRQEDGNFHYSLNTSKKDPDCLVFLEAWKDKEALKVHKATEHFQRILPQLVALCDGQPESEMFTQL